MSESENWDPEIDLRELEVDDEFRSHVAERNHFVRTSEVMEVLLGEPSFFDNPDATGEHRAPVIMVGRTAKGRCLVVPIEPTGRPGIWRAVTAYQAPQGMQRRYEQESDCERS